MNNDMSLVAQAGGHSVLGHSTTDGGMILDLSRLKGLDIMRMVAPAGPVAASLPASTQRRPLSMVSSPGLVTLPR